LFTLEQVNLHEKHFTDLFSKEKIVYLTAESDHLIDKIEDDHVYIIGGLVDHNSHKVRYHFK
jgi:tRNA (guanine9-N1)-methyltransferase